MPSGHFLFGRFFSSGTFQGILGIFLHFIIIPESCNPQKSIELLPFRFLQIKKTSTSHQIYRIQHQTPQNYKIITSLEHIGQIGSYSQVFFGGENNHHLKESLQPRAPKSHWVVGSSSKNGLKKPPPWALDQAPVAPTVDLDLPGRVEMDGVRMVLGCDGFGEGWVRWLVLPVFHIYFISIYKDKCLVYKNHLLQLLESSS